MVSVGIILDKKKRLELALARVPGHPVPFDKHDYLIIFSYLNHWEKLSRISLLNKKYYAELKNSSIARENTSWRVWLASRRLERFKSLSVENFL